MKRKPKEKKVEQAKLKRRSCIGVPPQMSCAFGGTTFHVGDTVYGLDDRGVWCAARIITIKGGRVKLHYQNSTSEDAWKTLASRQVRANFEEEGGEDDDDDDGMDTSRILGTAASAGSKRGLEPYGGDFHSRGFPHADAGMNKALRHSQPPTNPTFDEAYSFLGEGSPPMAPLPSQFDEHRQMPPYEISEPPLDQYPVAVDDAAVDGAAMIYESDSPIASKHGGFGFDSRLPMNGQMAASAAPKTHKLTDITNAKMAGEYIKGLQLTRDFLRTLQQQPLFDLDSQKYLVRLNMGSKFFLYVAAQIVSVIEDELHVRGVDKTHPEKIQTTKLAYVSNATFKDDEIVEVLQRLRSAGLGPTNVLNLPLRDVTAMIEKKNAIMQLPSYKFFKSQMHNNATGSVSSGAPALPAPAPPLGLHQAGMMLPPTSHMYLQSATQAVQMPHTSLQMAVPAVPVPLPLHHYTGT